MDNEVFELMGDLSQNISKLEKDFEIEILPNLEDANAKQKLIVNENY